MADGRDSGGVSSSPAPLPPLAAGLSPASAIGSLGKRSDFFIAYSGTMSMRIG